MNEPLTKRQQQTLAVLRAHPEAHFADFLAAFGHLTDGCDYTPTKDDRNLIKVHVSNLRRDTGLKIMALRKLGYRLEETP